MTLLELNPTWCATGGEGVTVNGLPKPRQEKIGVEFDCPCGCDRRCFVAFVNPVGGGKPFDPPNWQRTGETFADLTLTPSILRSKAKGGCGWHGFITNGQVTTC